MKLQQLIIIEDVATDAALTERTVHAVSPGVNVLTFPTAEDALQMLAHSININFILLDLTLPGGMDGIAFIDRLRQLQNYIKTPVVVLTGSMTDVARAYHAGVDDYVVKPLTKDRYIEIVETLGFEL